MPLTPEEIEARRFRLAQNGYDCEAVDRFLAEIADACAHPAPAPAGRRRVRPRGPGDRRHPAQRPRQRRRGAGRGRGPRRGRCAPGPSSRPTTCARRPRPRPRRCASAGHWPRPARRPLAAGPPGSRALRTSAQADADQIRLEAERQLEQADPDPLAGRRADRRGPGREPSARRRPGSSGPSTRPDDGPTRSPPRPRSGPRPSARASSRPTCGCWRPATTCSWPSTGWWPTSTAIHARPRRRGRRRARRGPVGGRPDHGSAPGPPGPATTPSRRADATTSSPAGPADRLGRPRHRGSSAGDPLLRMVRAAVGRAAEGSSGEGPDREASASWPPSPGRRLDDPAESLPTLAELAPTRRPGTRGRPLERNAPPWLVL